MPDFEAVEIALSDGYRAYGRYWPVAQPRGAVLYHHGIQSHAGWYEGSARRLQEAGFAVLQPDRRGSGRNAGQRGHAESADQLIDDALAARDELRRRSGCDAYHVVGVSWGGKLAVCAYVREPAGVTGLSLVTPGLFPIVNLSGEEKWKIGQAMLYEPLKQIDIPLNEPELFSAEPRWQAYFEADDLTLRQATASFYLATRRMDKVVAKLKAAAPVPVHLLLAGEEHIIQNDTTRTFIEELAWPCTRITYYERARHSLEFLAEAGAYFDDLARFVEAPTAAAAGEVVRT